MSDPVSLIAVLLFVAWVLWFTTSPSRDHRCIDCDEDIDETETWTEDEL